MNSKYLRSMTASIACLALLAGASAALAQVPSVQAVTPYQANTYGAAITALAPAASATDFFTITGAANKIVQVRKLQCNGVSTANAAAIVKLVKRSVANSAGTATTPTKVPFNSSWGVAASATVRAYTANPTVGAVIGDIAVGELVTGPAASATLANPSLVFDLTGQNIFLNSAAEVLALNGNGASFTSGAALNCSVEWTEQ